MPCARGLQKVLVEAKRADSVIGLPRQFPRHGYGSRWAQPSAALSCALSTRRVTLGDVQPWPATGLAWSESKVLSPRAI